jgi:hypothetical protein
VATTIHIPSDLLKRVDQRAKALGASRNRIIRDAIEASLGANGSWPAELVSMLTVPLDPRIADQLETSLETVRSRRRDRGRAPKL